MNYYKSLSLFFSFALFLEVGDAGTLKGHVQYTGRDFGRKKLKMNADPVCGSSHSGPVYSESFKISGELHGD